LHLDPAAPGWVDLAAHAPIMNVDRARDELGWSARYSSEDAVGELLEGFRQGAGFATPPLDPATSQPARIPEVGSGVGER
jgi:hypothetical protein